MELFEEPKGKKRWHYLKDTAMIGLLITVAISTFQIYQASRQTKQLSTSLQYLDNVEKALTTHFLGAFPGYISEINNLLQSFKENNSSYQNDTIVIFEDVLHYGIMSSTGEFIKMNKLLLELAEGGCHIVIAYYDPNPGRSVIFKRMVEDELISPTNLALMRDEISLNWKENRDKIDTFREKYFDLSRKHSSETIKAYEEKVSSYRQSIYSDNLPTKTSLDKEMATLCMELDSVKQYYMGDSKRDVMSITFNDFVNMYRSFDILLKKHYMRNERSNFIELIEMNEYMPMSCWLVRDKAILAFPSKYSSDEMGFESQDNAFVDYIHTMLFGVRSMNKNKDME